MAQSSLSFAGCRARLLVSCVALATCGSAACGTTEAPRVVEVVDPVYRPGQEWSFDTRPGEESATLIVLRTDDVAGERVVHVALRGVRVRSPVAPDGFTTEIAHVPMTRRALEASRTTLARETVTIPPFEDGYAEWAAAQGGVWSVPVAEVIDAVEQALSGAR